MNTLVWGMTFKRAYKQVTSHHPDLRQKIERALEQPGEDPFDSKLHTHKLKGELSGVWACTVDCLGYSAYQLLAISCQLRSKS